MKIILVCERVEMVSKGKYRCMFRQLPHGQNFIEAELDCPAIPGEHYNVLLRGIFPGYADNRNCVTDMMSFTVMDVLKGVDLDEEMKILEEKTKRN